MARCAIAVAGVVEVSLADSKYTLRSNPRQPNTGCCSSQNRSATAISKVLAGNSFGASLSLWFHLLFVLHSSVY